MSSALTKQIKKRARSKKDNPEQIVKFFNTGCTLLDLALGGGFAQGALINIIGDKSSGKTLLTVECLAKNKLDMNSKLKIIYDDAEAAFNFNTEEMYGVEFFDEDFPRSNTIEDFDLNFNKNINKLKDDEKMIYVLDSFDAIGSLAENEKIVENRKKHEDGKKETGDYNMAKQKKSGQYFREMVKYMRKKKCSLLIISQVRENIGVMFGAKYTRSGGKALDFYASQAIWLAETAKMIKMDRAIGIRVKARITKNKCWKPFRECFFDILFDYGIDDVTSNINYLYDLIDKIGKLKSKREKVEWDNNEYTVSGLVNYIEENNLEEELKKRVIEKWNKIEDSISPNERKKKY